MNIMYALIIMECAAPEGFLCVYFEGNSHGHGSHSCDLSICSFPG